MPLAAQTPPPEPAPLFRSSTALVSVDVLVTENRRPVTGLGEADFIVREDRVVRPIEGFAHTAAPLEVALVLDVSGSMGKMLRSMAAAGRQALDQLAPQDEVAVLVFARRARVSLELTTEKALAARALREAAIETSLGAGTSLNDALLETARYFSKRPPFAGRRAVIVLTDNGGVHFRLPDEDVIRALSGVNVVVNAIVPAGARPPVPPAGPDVNPDFTPADVFRIAAATGGEVLRSDDAGGRFRDLIERIRLRYNLMLRASAGAPGTFHRLDVELAGEARRRYPKAEVRARAGYYAAGE